jgi:DNA primase
LADKVTIAGGGQYIGVAPCGTALTERQVAALRRLVSLRDTGVLVALDGDRAGRQGAIKAHGLLRSLTTKAVAVVLPDGRDPADILKFDGPAALATAHRERAQPLATLVVDARLDQWGRRLDDIDGQLYAMRDVAARIASALPPNVAERITEVTGGKTP